MARAEVASESKIEFELLRQLCDKSKKSDGSDERMMLECISHSL
jgi:hypothetical protein